MSLYNIVDMAANTSKNLSQAVKSGLRVPVGHIIVSGRWRSTELVADLQKSIQVHYEDSLGVVDFHPSSSIGVIYVSEADAVCGTGYRQKCVKLRMANRIRGIVIVERTPASDQYFKDVQIFCGLEIGLSVVPVSGPIEAAGFLKQLVHAEGKQSVNVFKKPAPQPNVDSAVLATLRTVPTLGEVKARQLLAKFKRLVCCCWTCSCSKCQTILSWNIDTRQRIQSWEKIMVNERDEDCQDICVDLRYTSKYKWEEFLNMCNGVCELVNKYFCENSYSCSVLMLVL